MTTFSRNRAFAAHVLDLKLSVVYPPVMFGLFRRKTAEVVDHSEPPYAGRVAVFTIVVALANVSLWCFGVRQQELLDAVEQGAAVIDDTSGGEVEEDQIRESIRLQRQSFRFWSTITMLGDLVIEPLSPLLRALAVTVAFSAAAAMFGRPIGYGIAMAENVGFQVFWVAGAVLTAALKILIAPSATNSLLVFLPPDVYPANVAMLLESLHPLAICGWLAIAWGGWKRKQANLFVAALMVAVMAFIEASTRSTVLMLLGAAIRLTFVSQ